MYKPMRGDIIQMDFNPQAGHEQAGRRPALVVSNKSFHRYTNMAIVCPITNQIKPYPMHVPLDKRTKTSGEVLCEHVKSVDLVARNAMLVERLPDDLMNAVFDRIKLSIEQD